MKFMLSYYRERTIAIGTILVEGDDAESAKVAFEQNDALNPHPLGGAIVVKVEPIDA